MDESLKKEPFTNLSIKCSVARKFIDFSKKISRSRSLTLLVMIDFFEENRLSPLESLGPGMDSLELAIKRRINDLIAIVRDIEKQHTIPTKGMLEAILYELPATSEKTAKPTFEKALKNLVQQTDKPSVSLPTDHADMRLILSCIEHVRPSFGKNYYKLNLDQQQLEKLKNKYHVYHD